MPLCAGSFLCGCLVSGVGEGVGGEPVSGWAGVGAVTVDESADARVLVVVGVRLRRSEKVRTLPGPLPVPEPTTSVCCIECFGHQADEATAIATSTVGDSPGGASGWLSCLRAAYGTREPALRR